MPPTHNKPQSDSVRPASRAARGKRQSTWRSFTLQLLLITILPLSLLVVVVAFGSQTLHHDAMRSLVGDRDLRTVTAAAGALERELFHRAAALQMIADNAGSLEAGESGTASIGTQNPDLSMPMPGGEETALLFDQGIAVFSGDGTLVQSIASTIDWQALVNREASFLQQVRQNDGTAQYRTLAAADGTEQAVMLVGTVSGQQLVLGAFSTAALIEEVTRSLVGSGQMRVLVAARAATDGEVVLVYQSGAPVSTHGSQPLHGVIESLNGQSGLHYPEGHESDHVVAYAPVSPPGWGLVIEEAWEDIASPYLNTTQSAPLIIVPVFLLTLVALWFGVSKIVRPLQELEGQAARLADGEFDAIQQPVGGIQEIQSLQGELAEMARNLQAAQHNLHGYIGAITAGIENERRNLARELHDDTIQSLIALNQRIQLTMMNTPERRKGSLTNYRLAEDDRVEDSRAEDGHVEDNEVVSNLAELQGLVQQTMVSLRRMIRGLRPIYLEDLGLTAALKMLVQEQDTTRLPIRFEMHGVEQRFDPQTEMSLYRMVQESLSNVLHHADAAQARVDMAFYEGGLTIKIQDDGKGFLVPADPSEFAQRGHFGLLGLQERAELISAELRIRSNPGEGTTVTIELERAKDDTVTR